MRAGKELFASFGTSWFRYKPVMKFVPFPGDAIVVELLLTKTSSFNVRVGAGDDAIKSQSGRTIVVVV